MTKIYLQLDWKTARMFEYSKDPKEGFEEHKTDTKTSYRRYMNKGVTGKLMHIGLKTDTPIGTQANIVFEDENGCSLICQFAYENQSGNIENKFMEPLIMYLGSLKKGETYTMFPYRIDEETQRDQDVQKGNDVKPKYYDKTGISFKQNGQRVNTYLIYSKRGEETDRSVPHLAWVKKATGKSKPSAVSVEAKNDFLEAEFVRCKEGHLAYGDAQNNNPVPPKPTATNDLPEVSSKEAFGEPDDLPF